MSGEQKPGAFALGGPACGNCGFWKYEEPFDVGLVAGTCHRYAPRPTFDVAVAVFAELARSGSVANDPENPRDQLSTERWIDRTPVWPAVFSDDFCGEWVETKQ